jgi:hypothetical protein
MTTAAQPASTLRFCQTCDALQLPHTNLGKFVFKCINCDSTTGDIVPLTAAENITIYKNGIRQTSQRVERLLPSMIYDNALKHTAHIVCPHTTCPSRDPARWGEFTPTGVRIEPDVLVTNFMSVDKTMTGICRICGGAFHALSS